MSFSHNYFQTNKLNSTRPLSATTRRCNEAIDISDVPPTPITHLSEIESAMADSVSKFANEVIAPRVREMDENEAMDPSVVEQLFEQGLMSVEIPEEFGGAGMNFTSAIIGIEELARVDPSVSVMCDVHNTLVNRAVLNWASPELKKTWLPRLATNTVGKGGVLRELENYSLTYLRFFLSLRADIWIRCLRSRYQGHQDRFRV
jgi:short-chain 2-methylacyl-CoA dehydrogenase